MLLLFALAQFWPPWPYDDTGCAFSGAGTAADVANDRETPPFAICDAAALAAMLTPVEVAVDTTELEFGAPD